MLNRRKLLTASVFLTTAGVKAQAVMPKQVRLVVPYPPGGSTDILARHIAKGMSSQLGLPVIIDNRGGANGMIAAENVARAEADGSTLLVVENAITVNPFLFKDFTVRPDKDFSAISLMGTAPVILVVNPSLPVSNVKELVAYARANPQKLSYGSGGNGNPTHICPEMFKLATGTEILQVPYKGSGPAVTDLIGGQVSMMFTGISAVKSFVEAGKLKAIAVTGTKRSPAMSQVPTLAESGIPIPELDQGSWWGIVGPSGMSRPMTLRIAEAIRQAGQDSDTRAKLEAVAITPLANSPEEFTRWIASELDKHANLVKQAKIATT